MLYKQLFKDIPSSKVVDTNDFYVRIFSRLTNETGIMATQ